MKPVHAQLASGRWFTLPFADQMAHIGSEVERALLWREKHRHSYASAAFERAIELLDLTVADAKNVRRLKELLRVREMLADFFCFDNEYRSTADSWRACFTPFFFASRRTASR